MFRAVDDLRGVSGTMGHRCIGSADWVRTDQTLREDWPLIHSMKPVRMGTRRARPIRFATVWALKIGWPVSGRFRLGKDW